MSQSASGDHLAPKVPVGSLDRRIIYLLIALSVAIPMMLHMRAPVVTSPLVQHIYDKVESLPAGSRILISLDYAPATIPENQPMAEAMTRHCLAKGHRVYLMTLWATGPAMVTQVIDRVIKADFPEKVYGTDYVNIGYKAGNQGVINSIVANLRTLYTTDVSGTPVDQIPMLKDVQSVRNFDLILGVGSGFPGLKEWVQFAGDRTNVPVGGGMTAVEAPLLMPYYPRQLLGIMGGLQGAAEYEAALVNGYPKYKAKSEQAIANMGPQTVAHIVIMGLIILGNITFFRARRAANIAKSTGGRS